MGPQISPEHPTFVNNAEKTVWEALRQQLRDEDVLLHGIRFTDPEDGEVEIDLLVLMPELGAAVVEVKGGHITYAHGQVRQTRADGVHVIDPAEQAAKEVRALQRFLERQPGWSRGRVVAAWLVAFPNTPVTDALGPRLRRDVVIGSADLDDAAGMVYDRLNDPHLRKRTPTPGWIDAALDHLIGTQDVAGEIAARAVARLEHVDQLTEQQSSVLSLVRAIPRFCVTGAAGTGKTWLAIEQARRWAKAGERVCFLSYTRGVIESVRRALADVPVKESPAYVGTFFQLGHAWGIHADGADDPDFWAGRGAAEMLAHAEGLTDDDRFTAFVIDEAQDFDDTWWPVILAAGTPDARMAVFRDDEQAVFADRSGEPPVDLVPLVLEENLRNAQQVVDTFRPLIESSVVSKGGSGFPVEFVAAEPGGAMSAADSVVESLLEERGWLPEHIAVLTTQHRHPVQVEYGTDKAAYWNDLWSRDYVFYSTVGGFKGLERPVVVLAVDGFHGDLDPAHVLYTGMSRARDLLIVVGSPDVIEQAGGSKLRRRLERAASPLPTLPA